MAIVLFNHASFLLVALSSSEAIVITGVVCAAIAVALGDITFLSLTTRYHKSTLSGWSPGTGAAVVAGALILCPPTQVGPLAQELLV